jgi:hypothetical protein
MATGPIDFDNPDTWPPKIVALLDENTQLLRDHAAFEAGRYRRLGPGGPSERELAAIPNPTGTSRSLLLFEIESCLVRETMLAYHCTRLTSDEMADIRARGLRALNEATVLARLARRVSQGDLTRADANALLERFRALAAQERNERVDRVWAVSSVVALLDERALGQPLLHWGGEATLCTDVDCSRIGTACIVEFEATIDALAWNPLPEAFVEQHLNLRDKLGQDCSPDLCLRGSVASSNVLNIFERSNPEFERLTQCSGWSVDVT